MLNTYLWCSLRVLVHFHRSGHCSICSERILCCCDESCFDRSWLDQFLWCGCSIQPNATILAVLDLLPRSIHISCRRSSWRSTLGRQSSMRAVWICPIRCPCWTDLRRIHGRFPCIPDGLPARRKCHGNLFILPVLPGCRLRQDLQLARKILFVERRKFRQLLERFDSNY